MHASLRGKEGHWQSHHLEKAHNPQGSGQGVKGVGLSLWQYGPWEAEAEVWPRVRAPPSPQPPPEEHFLQNAY